jgi:hypothetical protein
MAFRKSAPTSEYRWLIAFANQSAARSRSPRQTWNNAQPIGEECVGPEEAGVERL